MRASFGRSRTCSICACSSRIPAVGRATPSLISCGTRSPPAHPLRIERRPDEQTVPAPSARETRGPCCRVGREARPQIVNDGPLTEPRASGPRWRPMLLALALALAYGAAQVTWGEQTPFAGGYHPDAVVYARAAGNLEEVLAKRRLQGYWVQRLAPTVVVHYAMRTLRVPLHDRNIILA